MSVCLFACQLTPLPFMDQFGPKGTKLGREEVGVILAILYDHSIIIIHHQLHAREAGWKPHWQGASPQNMSNHIDTVTS